jgi:hypothetical protein
MVNESLIVELLFLSIAFAIIFGYRFNWVSCNFELRLVKKKQTRRALRS